MTKDKEYENSEFFNKETIDKVLSIVKEELHPRESTRMDSVIDTVLTEHNNLCQLQGIPDWDEIISIVESTNEQKELQDLSIKCLLVSNLFDLIIIDPQIEKMNFAENGLLKFLLNLNGEKLLEISKMFFSEVREFIRNQNIEKRPKNFYQKLVEEMGEDILVGLGIEKETLQKEQFQSTNNNEEKIIFHYDKGGVVKIGDMEEIKLTEYPFVCFLFLAVKRKLDDKNYFVDRKREFEVDTIITSIKLKLKETTLEDTIKESGNHDFKFYFNYCPQLIYVDQSIKKFRSSHRRKMIKLLNEFEDVNVSTANYAKPILDKVEEAYYYVKRSEDKVDKIINILGWKPRNDLELKSLKAKYNKLHIILKKYFVN